MSCLSVLFGVDHVSQVDLSRLLGTDGKTAASITLVNGVELVTAVSAWGDAHETRSNHPSARFNSALRSFLYRQSM